LLDRLDAATKAEDMLLPGFGFHGLTGFKPKRYAVSVSGNWRITFAFDDGDAEDVYLEDYH
jgi:proteic killer suppression protein